MSQVPVLSLMAVLLLPVTAYAQGGTAHNEATELHVTAPPGYAVERIAPLQNQSVRYRVRKQDDRDTGCQVAFTPLPQNNGLTQEKIDTTLRDETWRATARSAISPLYDVRESDTFHGGRQAGFTMVADFKARPDLPPRAQEIRTLFVIQETPRGRTSTVCVGERQGFEARQKEFLAVAAGATPP